MRANRFLLVLAVLAAVPLAAAAPDPYVETVTNEGILNCSARLAPGPGTYNACQPVGPGGDVSFPYDADAGLTSIAVELEWTPTTTGSQTLSIVLARDQETDPLAVADTDEAGSDAQSASGRSPLLLVIPRAPADVQAGGGAYSARVAFPDDAGGYVGHGQTFTMRIHGFYHGAPLPPEWLPQAADAADTQPGLAPDAPASAPAADHADAAAAGPASVAARLMHVTPFLAGLAVLTAPVFFAGRLRHLFWYGLLPFFSRLDEDRVLDHPRRAHLAQLVRAAPGLPADEVRRRARLANGPFEYHVSLLVRRRVLQRQELDGRVYLWPAGRPAGRPDPGHLSPAQLLLDAVARHPGAGPTDLARDLGLPPKTLRYHALRLARRGRLRLEQDGPRVRCWPVA